MLRIFPAPYLYVRPQRKRYASELGLVAKIAVPLATLILESTWTGG